MRNVMVQDLVQRLENTAAVPAASFRMELALQSKLWEISILMWLLSAIDLAGNISIAAAITAAPSTVEHGLPGHW